MLRRALLALPCLALPRRAVPSPAQPNHKPLVGMALDWRSRGDHGVNQVTRRNRGNHAREGLDT